MSQEKPRHQRVVAAVAFGWFTAAVAIILLMPSWFIAALAAVAVEPLGGYAWMLVGFAVCAAGVWVTLRRYGWFLGWIYRRLYDSALYGHSSSDPGEATEPRPRFGKLVRHDGTEVLLVFHPTAEPGVFLARRAGDERPVDAMPGDHFRVDAMASGQSVTFETPQDEGPRGGHAA